MNREIRFWASLAVISDMVAIIVAWLLAYWVRFRSGWIVLAEGNIVHPLDLYVTPALFSLVIFYWSFQQQAVYQRRSRNWGADARALLRGLVVGGPLLVALNYLLYRATYSRLVLALFVVLSYPLLLLGRYVIQVGMSRWLMLAGAQRRIVALCEGDAAKEILQEYLSYHPDVFLVRTLELERAMEISLESDRPDEVVVISPLIQPASLEAALRRLESELVDLTFIPYWSGFRLLGYDIEQAGRLPIIHLRRTPLYGWGGIGKRILDITVSFIALILASPLLGIIALLIWITSGRPVLYSQSRMGFDGRTFMMYKFRSMVAGADINAASAWTLPGDPRRTRIGAWLRRLSLDELPQLYNILRGDMSLVGPRPEMANLIEEFRQRIPHYYLRYKVKAGLTGWAQVHGLRGNTSLQQRIEYDLFYIEHWSLWLDMKILALTLVRGWRNAY